MRKAEAQATLKKGAEGEACGMAPPSPRIPPKRAKVSADQVVPDPADSVYPTPTPPVFIRKMRNAAVGIGCDIRLKVAVTGDPQPSLYWYCNEELLDMENQEYGGLWIRDCKPSDAGLYTCIANNYLGEAKTSAVLAVLDLGEDSENTEDEAAEPQIPMQNKEGPAGLQDQAAHRVPAGDSDRMMDVTSDASGRRGSRTDSWAGSEDTVVEKEAPALGSRAPGPQDLTKPARSQSEDVLREAHPQVLPPPSPKIGQRSTTPPIPTRSGSAPSTPLTPRKKVVVPSDYVDTVPAEFEDKIKQPKSSAMSQSSNQDSRPQTPVSEVSRKDLTLRPSPKLARASSKIFEKVRVFEERRKSIDNPEGSISGRSWAGFNRAASIDSDDGGSRLGISRESSREDLREALKADAAERRSMFRQRAASLEDRPRYSQKVQDIESKFTEELRRIKKLVGKPHLAKSFSTEQLSQRSRQPLRKLEPIPPQVLQKLQMRERNLQEEEKRTGQQKDQSPQRSPEPEQKPEAQKNEAESPPQQPETSKSSISSDTMSRFEEKEITPEAMSVAELPGQRSARPPARSSPVREPPQSSIVAENPDLAEDQSPVSPLHKGEPPPRKVEISVRQVERRPPSPLVQRGSPFVRELTRSPDSPIRDSLRDEPMPRKVNPPLRKVEQRPPSPLVQQEPRTLEHHVQAPTKPPRLARPSPPTRSPVSEQESMEVQAPPAPSAPKLPIPVIVVEEEPMEVLATVEAKDKVTKKGKEGAPHKARGKGCRARPMSPELESSDDSYVSAGEDPLEAPIFELPPQDTIASAGSDVLMSCVIAGTPDPEVTWRKEDEVMKNSATHTVKVEGERHSLLIKKTKPSDAGTYCVTATNEVGRATCTATLFVQAEPRQEARGALSVPMDLCSPITSDEEYLSPMEEGMDFGGPTYRRPELRKIVDARFRESPSFQVTLTDQVVTEGQEVTMCVRMKGQPKPMIYWLRDRVTIKTAGRHIVRETEDGTFEMKITSTLRSDMGVYTCKIVNEYGSQQCDCRLEVKAAPAEQVLSVTQHVSDMTVNAGETALFECHMTGPQDVDVDWLSDGRLIQPALLNCKMHFDGKRCRLLLNSVHEDDSGTYTCKLSTAKEELTSSATLKVIPSVPPLFTRKLDVLEVIEGRTARFDCKISGTPPPRVCWSHFEHTIADSENVRIMREGGRHSLVIMHVTSENEGFYTITARNAHGEAECAAELYVQEPRPAISSQMAKLEKMPSIPEEPEMTDGEMERFTMPDFVKPLYDLDVVEGKEAVLKCKVAGLPYPTITWFHNGKKIENTDERKMTQYRDIHSLVIRCVCHAHGGVYKSVISNKVGKAACYAHLYVTDVLPDPPDGAAVIQGVTGKTVTLSWRKPRRLDPSLDPSSLMYAIQQQAIGSVQWTIIVSGLRQTSYTLTSLCKGVYYSFRVLSTINKTYSKPSPPTEPVQLLDRGPYLQEAPVIIDKPDVVYIVGNQSLSITVTLNHVQAAVTWKKQDVVLEHTAGMFEMSMPDDDQHTLKLVKVRSSDVGQIICMASNQFGSDSCILTLERAVPPTFESIMEDLDVQIGETPRFAVVVEGKPVPDIMWYKNDTLLSDSSHFSFVYDDNECSLVVLNVQEEDSGVYTCTAKNLAGVVSCKAELTVRIAAPDSDEAMEDEESVLRKMRRLTDYYDIHKEIGRGAFSYVKRVTEKTSKEEYAAKFISARAKKKTSALREMHLLSRLDHERILYFHDAFEKKNAVIVITELCHEEFLDKFTKKSSIMESEIRSITRQLLEGVNYLHQNNIMHLDIKPENILMADSSGEQIRICDFGNAMELTPDEAQYCKYGTPEFVAPEIVNQTPVCKATDIWPVGVMTYLCLTGVSPFAGENDRCTLLNIRNYNVAFEEGMFADLCREAKGFVIKLLVAERLRPDANECLRHPWFKLLTKGKSISTESLKQFLSRRKWQRSLISYKSKMVMRSIPELLDDSSNHISIAVPRHLKEGSPPPSSSSDSDEDIDELPFIPMPHIMDFSGSRMSLTEIPGDEDDVGRPNGTVEGVGKGAQGVKLMECEPSEKDGGETAGRGRARKRATQEEAEESSDEETAEAAKRPDQPKRPLRKGSSMDSEKGEGVRRRGELRRGSSADSALLLHIKPEEGTDEGAAEDGKKVLKKAVSMELPRRSPSPGTGKMSQEDYALKLELMRQRLLRGGAVDNKMSGLRGPLLETLGMADEKRYSSLDRYTRPSRLGVAPLIRAASSESPRDDTHKTKVLRKSASFSQGDAEPIPLHRRSGAPLEIPLAQIEERRLQEAPSMSALTEQPRLDSLPATPKELSKPPTPELDEQEQAISSRMKQDASEESRGKLVVDQGDGASERRMRMLEEEREEEAIKECERVSERMSQSGTTPSTVEEQTELKVKDEREKEYYAIRMKEEQEKHQGASPEITVTTSSITFPPVATKTAPTYISSSPPARITLPDGRTSAYASIIQTIMVPSLQPADTSALAFTTPTIASTPTPPVTSMEPEPPSSTEHPAVFSRVASTEQPAKEPSPTKTSPDPTLPRETSAGQDIEDITSEEIFESRFKKRESSLTRGLKLLTKSKGEEKQSVEAAGAGEEIYRPGPIGAPLDFSRRLEKSKSVQDLREASKDSSFMKRFSMRLKRSPSTERKEEIGTPDSGTLRRRLSWNLGRNRTQDKKEVEMVRLDGVAEPQLEEEASETKKSTESPVLVMRKKIESTVAGISMRIRSHSMDRKEEKEDKEAKPESKRTPLLSILRRTSSEGVNLKKIGQSSSTASTESLESTSSIQSETSTKTTESERRSRWDRWGLTRGRKDKTVSQPDIPSAIARENGSLRGRQYSRLASDFPPVFHIKLRDHVLLEGDPVTLSCLPAGSPHPRISWMKDKKKLHIDARMNAISCPDGRQLLMIMKTTKNDAGLYECVASNPLATVTSSCLISLARLPNRPGTPEIPQKYKNTALVLWRPSDTLAPCTYSLERRTEGETNWLIVATGVAECYYNATDLPEGGTFRFRVACVNKAGQGPYSNLSEKVCLDTSGAPKPSGVVIVKTIPSPKPSAETSSVADLTIEPTVPSEALEPSAPPVPTSTDATPPQEPGLPAPMSTRTTPPPESGPPVPTPSRISPPRGTGEEMTTSEPLARTPTPTAAATPPPSAGPSPPSPHTITPVQISPTVTPTKAKTTINITVTTTSSPAPPTESPAPPVQPKSQSPVSIAPPTSQTAQVSPPPLVSPPPAIGKPISSVPLYVPATTAPALPAGPALSPPVVLVTSLSPVGDGTATPSRMTPTGRATPTGRITPSGRRTPSGKPGESSLRQGVPQKPYTFMDEKARGRFGVIRECRENATGKLFMAKIVPYEPDSKQTVLQEYDILKSLHHSRIMALHEAYVTPRYLVLISECCSGKEVLYSLIDRFRYSEDDVVTYLVQILQGLDYLHNRRILHLDIKPDNIIITPMNSVKIIDFGSAQTFNPLFLKQFGRRVGTLEFMSPEMVKGDVVGPPADMWSIGVLTFIMLSGRLPFMEKDPKDTEAKIQVARFDLTKLYPNVSQSASLFLKKILCSYPWARPTIKDCFSNSWLQDAYLMKLRRQTLTFTTTRLKEFLVEHQRRRTETATKHKVLLRSYQSTAQSPATPTTPTSPTTPVPTTPTPAPTTPGTK